ncbi:MAG: MazG family protein [Acidimicrobiia bacterium]
MSSGRIDIVGLGPAGIDMMLVADRHRWDDADLRFLRTAVHPAAEALLTEGDDLLGGTNTTRTFDAVYDAAETIESVYRHIADAVLDAAPSARRVVYAVPGNPRVAERAVELICEGGKERGIAVVVHPAIGIDDIARARMGRVDSLADGHDPNSVNAAHGSVLVTQVDSSFALSDVKLELLDRGLSGDLPIAFLRRLGTPDEWITWVPLVEIDRESTDHLTSLWFEMPVGGVEVPTTTAAAMTRLMGVAERLRGPGGCSWDATQTHHSLRQYVLEEAYEVVDVIDQLPVTAPNDLGGVVPEAYDSLEDELGDLLYQVVFHSVLAAEADAFTIVEVINRIHDKLVRRHPHVFGAAQADDPDAVRVQWEEIKAEERNHASPIDAIPRAFPPLLYASKLLARSKHVGVAEPTADQAFAAIEAARDRLRGSERAEEREQALGQIMGAAVGYARVHDIDVDAAIMKWATRLADDLRSREHGGS